MPYDKPFLLDDNGQPYLTREQAIEDYLYMWKTLEENAPYLADLPNYPQWAENTPQQIKERYLEDLKGQPRNMDLDSYASFMSKSLSELESVGHIFVIPESMHEALQTGFKMLYDEYMRDYISDNEREIFLRIDEFLNNSKTVEFYRHFNNSAARPDDETERLYFLEEVFNSNVRFASVYSNVKGNSPYITIKSFGFPPIIEYLEYAAERLIEFFEKNKDAENIIIDIRGNRGGNTFIWSEGIVKPLISDTLTSLHMLGFINGGLNTYLWGGEYPVNLPDDWRNYFPNVGDILRFDTISLSENEYSDNISVGFNGKIWLLVDGSSASASDAFAVFCKQTGFATVIGTQTSGTGTGAGSPYAFPLPNSGMLIYYEPWYVFNEDGTCNQIEGTEPDIDVGDRDALDVVRELIAEG